MAVIVPSILSADFARLGQQVEEAQAGGADRIQIDVMDGRFVPNITVGPMIVEAVRRHTNLPLEAHLMIAINPATPLATLQEILSDIDLALCMTVNPGFGGQAFIQTMVGKIERLRAMIQQHGGRCDLEVDGGISAATAPVVTRAGANVLVAGSSVYGAAGGAAAGISALRAAIG
jgi:ribulose-phosphate 3-epimerase